MKIQFNPYIKINIQPQKLKQSASVINSCLKENSNISFEGKNKRKSAAAIGAALIIAANTTPLISGILSNTSKTEPVLINENYTDKTEISSKMQQITQRIFEIDEELEQIAAELVDLQQKDIELLQTQIDLYDRLDLAETDEEKVEIRKELDITDDEWFKNVGKFGSLDAREGLLNGNRIWLCEELYRLYGYKTGNEDTNVDMPVSQEKYAYTDSQYEDAVASSKKNTLYLSFENMILSELEDSSPVGITAKITELSLKANNMKEQASEYLAGIEFYRAEITKKVSEIQTTSAQLKETDENSDSAKELKSRLKTLQSERDALSKSLSDFKAANETAYNEYIQILIELTVLENLLNL